MQVLVVYESRGGRTAKTASAIADVLRGAGHDVVLASVADAQPADAATADLIVVGSWTEGFILFGVGPAKAAQAWLDRLPSLEGRRAAVFCTYAFFPRGTLDAMASRLTARGATVVARRAVHRRNPLAGVAEFARSAAAAIPS
ncbi:MAG TPA: flavodoxin domain-containing protein [Actinomycetes bacterium]|jgi:flavodoxin|nr:flavodoxin domain-containing protein [Actinomycetes bacterium]